MAVNYAQYAGFSSLPAAIVFAVLYVPFLLWFVKKSFTHPTYVHYVMALFCAIRVTAFVLRAILIGSEDAGENLRLLIGDQIVFGIGYAGLLYASYTLVLDLKEMYDKVSTGARDELIVIRATRNRHLYRLVLVAAVTLGIIASSTVNNDGTATSAANTLRQASTVLFLVLTALLVIQTFILVQFKKSVDSNVFLNESFGSKHASSILVIIAFLLLIREAFVTATMSSSMHKTQLNEHFWYPFLATPELIAIMFYSLPGIVPSKRDLDLEKSPA